LEDARGERLQELRANPLQPLGHTEARTLYLAAARSLRKKAYRRPSMGPAQVFIVAEAEALAPQGTSSEAANALLKLLEEPPAGTTLILTSAEPGRLLPTIRSRTTQIHLPPLTVGEVREFLLAEAGVDEGAASRAAGRAGGSIGRALGFLDDGDDPGPLEQIRRQALGLLSAALAKEPEVRATSALSFKPVGARGLRDLFSFLEESLEELARVASGLPLEGTSEAESRFYREAVDRWKIQPSYLPPAMDHVDRARTLAEGNVNPQLVVFGLLRELRQELVRGVPTAEQGRHHGF
jgi:DNA polymerase-3 subunit delta'